MRHSKRCSPDAVPPSRRKSCRDCVASKSRCDLQRPVCGRCQVRDIDCEFASQGDVVEAGDTSGISTTNLPGQNGGSSDYGVTLDSPSTFPSSHTSGWTSGTSSTGVPSLSTYPALSPSDIQGAIIGDPEDVPVEVTISEARRRVLLGTAPNRSPGSGEVSRHIMNFITRMLRSWPRLMESYHTALLPPMIHRVQLEDGVPTPLANCYALVRMWSGHAEGSGSFVRETIVSEIRRLMVEARPQVELEVPAS